MKTGCLLDTILHQLATAKCNDSLADKAEPRRRVWLPTVIIYIAVKQKHLCEINCILLMTIQALCTQMVRDESLNTESISKPRHVNAFPLVHRSPDILSILDKAIFGDQHI